MTLQSTTGSPYCKQLNIGSPIGWAHELSIKEGMVVLYSGLGKHSEYCDWDMIALKPKELLCLESTDVLGSEHEAFSRLETFMTAPWRDDQGLVITEDAWLSLSQHLNVTLPMAHCALSYELGAQAIGVDPRSEKHLTPSLWAARYQAIYLFKRDEGTGWLISASELEMDMLRTELSQAYVTAQKSRSAHPIQNTSLGEESISSSHHTHKRFLSPALSYQEYCGQFEHLQEAILNGDVYQMNLTLPFSCKRLHQESSLSLFKRLCKVNAGQFSAFLQLDKSRSIISLSPERLARWSGRKGERHEPGVRWIETAPIKGTRPRRSDPEADEAERRSLINSVKDDAEHVMILDLERNDLGKLCESGSVEVLVDREARRYATVHHLVSVVRGRLSPTAKLTDILNAIFPGGSVTGAPKLRSMELIRKLEIHPRGVYCGALGYIDPLGGGDLNLPIRTLFCDDDTIVYHAGGGIVADSSPHHEWEEVWVKTQGVECALREVIPRDLSYAQSK